jgi:hypothetical protein
VNKEGGESLGRFNLDTAMNRNPQWIPLRIQDVRDRLPPGAGAFRFGCLGRGLHPNYQYTDQSGVTVRCNGRTHRFVGYGSFNPKHLTEIVPL